MGIPAWIDFNLHAKSCDVRITVVGGRWKLNYAPTTRRQLVPEMIILMTECHVSRVFVEFGVDRFSRVAFQVVLERDNQI